MPTWDAGTDCIIKIDSTSGGSLADVSDYCSTITLDTNINIGGFYTFGLDDEQTSEGKQSHTCAIGVRPATDSGGMDYIAKNWVYGTKGLRSFQIQEPDAMSGSFQYDFEAYPASYQAINKDAGGDGTPPTQSLQVRPDGAVTFAIIT